MKKFYRYIESIIFKTIRLIEKVKNTKFQQSINSAIYKLNKNNKMLLTRTGSIKYFLITGDNIAKYLYINNTWNFHVLEKALKILNKDYSKSTLINIGAHIGSTCIPAVKKKKFKNAIAFEPLRKNFKLLETNINLNFLEDRIEAYNLALSSKKRKLFIKQFDVNSGDCRILNKKQKKSQIINCEKLDNFTAKFRKKNSLIFMYAQGHEPEIFLGARKTIQRKIPIITQFIPSLFNDAWLKKLSFLFTHYNYFYDLKKNEKKKLFKPQEIIKLHSEYIANNNYTDILIV